MPFELEVLEWEPALPLFQNFYYDLAWLDSALHDNLARLFVDQKTSPEIALLCHRSGDCLIGGDPASTALPEVLEYALFSSRPAPWVGFVIPPSDDWCEPILAHFGNRFEALTRVDFTFGESKLAYIKQWRDRVPAGFSLERLDEKLASRIKPELDHDFRDFWPSLEEFANFGVGFALVQEGAPVSLAYSAFRPRRRLEIATATLPEFRGRGFSPLTAAALIDYSLEQGVEPHWSTEINNHASRIAALKLGFENEEHHQWLKHKG